MEKESIKKTEQRLETLLDRPITFSETEKVIDLRICDNNTDQYKILESLYRLMIAHDGGVTLKNGLYKRFKELKVFRGERRKTLKVTYKNNKINYFIIDKIERDTYENKGEIHKFNTIFKVY